MYVQACRWIHFTSEAYLVEYAVVYSCRWGTDRMCQQYVLALQ